MATLARSGRNTGAALVFILGAAVFLNYVDRGAIAIASPVMKGELGLSAEAYGIAAERLADIDGLAVALKRARATGKPHVIEITVD